MDISVALLTGGSDKPYALGLASALARQGVRVEFVGSDELDCPEVHCIPGLTFRNLRGDQREDAPFHAKLVRVLLYYCRLLRYVATSQPGVLHILWNSRFEYFDRTLLMLYYRLWRKRVVLTAHNVNAAARDGRDGWTNRQSLRIQYHLCDHIFVHTDAMKRQLVSAFGVPEARITVVPFGINDTIPRSDITSVAARRRLGVGAKQRSLLFFGQIAPYKGLHYLIEAMALLRLEGHDVRLILAGKVKRGSELYWDQIEKAMSRLGIGDLVVRRIQFIPDDEVEIYFKSADAVVLPYVDIFQSGVPFLAFTFGLPIIASDVGSLREDVTSATGFLCKPKDPADLARAISAFYQSPLHLDSDCARRNIRSLVSTTHSWQSVGADTRAIYEALASGTRSKTAFTSTEEPRQTGSSRCQE